MPAIKNMQEFVAELRELVDSGDHRKGIQFVCRFPAHLALKLAEECVETNEQPPEAIRRLTAKAMDPDALDVHLDPFHIRIVNTICAATGQSRQDVIRSLITEFGVRKAAEINAALKNPTLKETKPVA